MILNGPMFWLNWDFVKQKRLTYKAWSENDFKILFDSKIVPWTVETLFDGKVYSSVTLVFDCKIVPLTLTTLFVGKVYSTVTLVFDCKICIWVGTMHVWLNSQSEASRRGVAYG